MKIKNEIDINFGSLEATKFIFDTDLTPSSLGYRERGLRDRIVMKYDMDVIHYV